MVVLLSPSLFYLIDMTEYRITEIGGWYRVRDQKNNVIGAGNSIDEAITDAINTVKKKS